MKKKIDWEAIEREYRAGQLSIREIARQHNISNPAIIRKAKKEGWERDLSERIRQKVNVKLVSTEVSTKVSTTNAREIIEEAAARGVEIVRFHRKYIKRLLSIGESIMGELEKEYDPNNLNPILDSRSKADLYRSLGQVMAKAIPLERQAFNLDDNSPQNKNMVNMNIATQRDSIRKQLESNPELKDRLQNAFNDE